MHNSKQMITGLGVLANNVSAADARSAEPESCYSAATAGQNDYATSSSAYSSTATQDFQKDAWLYVPKGTCGKISGRTVAVTTPAKK